MSAAELVVDAGRAELRGPIARLEAILDGRDAAAAPDVSLLAAGLDTVRRPLARLRADGLGTRLEAVVGAGVGLVLVELADGQGALRACTPSGLLGLLVAAVGLQPRPRGAGRPIVRLTTDRMAALVGRRSAAAAGLVGEDADRVQPVLDGLERHWRLEARPIGPGAGWYLEAVDSTLGLWLVEEEGGLVVLRPTDPTALLDEIAALPGRVGLGRSA